LGTACIPLGDFRSRVASLSLEELFDQNIQERLSSWLDEAVGFSLPVVCWRTAAEYRYDGRPIVIPEGDPAVWNKDYTPNEGINAQNSEDRAFAVFESQPYCAAVIKDGQIASMSYREKDGPISIFARPASRRKGYALSCLRLLTKKRIAAGFTPSYPEDVSNVASVHFAEKAGYKRQGYMFWITIPPIAKEVLPSLLKEV
jgi:hypothetical protein